MFRRNLWKTCIFMAAASGCIQAVSGQHCQNPLGRKYNMTCYGKTDLITDNYDVKYLTIYRDRSFALLPSNSFSHFKAIQTLTMYCVGRNEKNCENLQLKEDLLNPVKSTLEMFIAMSSNVHTIAPNLFCGMSKLHTINLSYNHIRNLTGIGFGNECKINSSGKSVQSISFTANEITVLLKNTFILLSNLETLELLYNTLTSIEDGSFAGLTNIREIFMSHNNLRSLPENLFQGLTKLTELRLENNQITTTPSLMHTPALGNLVLSKNILKSLKSTDFKCLNLQRLDLSNNFLSNQTLDNSNRTDYYLNCHTTILKLSLRHNNYDSLPNLTFISYLEELNLQTNAIRNLSQLSWLVPNTIKTFYLDRNNIKIIGTNDFTALVHLETLQMCCNEMYLIAPGAFDHNVRLVHIKLDSNRLTTLDGLFDSIGLQTISAMHNHIQYFSYTIHNPIFMALRLGFNNITDFTFHNLRLLSNSSSTIIDFTFNRLTNISRFKLPISVTDVLLNDNKITFFDVMILSELPMLRSINLDVNHLESLCEYNLCSFWQNQRLGPIRMYLSDNVLQCSCETDWMRNSSNGQLTIDNEDLYCHSLGTSEIVKIQELKRFQCQTGSSKCQRRLRNTGTECKNRCPDMCHCFVSEDHQFVGVNCSRSNLTRVPDGVMDFNSVYYYLDGNTISYLNQSAITMPVQRLYLNNSHLEHVHKDAFSFQHQLTVLHLENNLLQDIPKGTFTNLINLKELYLSNNQLSQIGIQGDLGMLEVLELQNNLFTNFALWDVVNINTLKTLKLDNNPWICECSFVMGMQHFLIQSNNVVDAENVFCESVSIRRRIATDSFEECKYWVWAVIIGILALLIIFCILIIRYRFEIRVLLYSWGCTFVSRQIVDMPATPYKVFDIFIYYSAHDEAFLTTNILPNLEDINDPYRVCLLERDLAGDGNFADKYMDDVRSSRTTLILLSDNFSKDQHCCHFFKMAYHLMIDDKRNRIMVVVKDKLPDNLDIVIKYFLKANRYLTWGECLFWRKFYFAFPDKLQLVNEPEEETRV